jgi:3-oxoadipate enol-lactonase
MDAPSLAARTLAIAVGAVALVACGGPEPRDPADAPPADEPAGFVLASAGPLYYESRGTGPAVVLLHGGNLDRRLWDPQFELLAKEGYHAVRYDIRPYGRSSPATEPYSDVADLRQLLDSLGLDSVTLVGLSLGGQIATDFALEHPDRVDRLVLAGPGMSGYRFHDSGRAARFHAAYERGGVPEVVEEWLRDPYMSPAMERQELAPALRAIALENARAWRLGSRFHESSELDPPAVGRLEEIRAPTLILVGERDVEDIHAIAQLLRDGIPHAHFAPIAGAGHLVNLEAPDAFNDALLRFLAEGRTH